MMVLPTFVDRYWQYSLKRFGKVRSPVAPASALLAAARRPNDDPKDLEAWVDVIMCGVEGALRADATPYLVAQTLVNRLNRYESIKLPPPLPHAPESAK